MRTGDETARRVGAPSRKPELLAPAGGWESFVAAVENGADAVYAGGRRFSARASAENFGPEEIRRAADYAHVRGVRLYLALNTLVAAGELDEAVAWAKEARGAGVDAVIVQDLGLAARLRREMPDLPLHASTQMTTTDLAGARLLAGLGFSRVILARELGLEEIRTIARESGVGVEAFVHGALCMGYSGQCLLSASVGGLATGGEGAVRSANRGACAQPCRLPWTLEAGGASGRDPYPLSPKDLCLVDDLSALAEAGVAAVKIEGRLKGPEYVAVVTAAYRKALDGTPPGEEERRDLLQAFNRGFTRGHFGGVEADGAFLSGERPKNRGIPAGTVVERDRGRDTFVARLSCDVEVGDGIEVWGDGDETPGGVASYVAALPGGLTRIGDIRGKVRPGDPVWRTSSKRLEMKARESFRTYRRKVEADAALKVAAGEIPELTVSDRDGHRATARGERPAEIAADHGLDAARAEEQVRKSGGTPFEFASVRVVADGKAAMSVAEINRLRRDALADLEAARAAEPPQSARTPGWPAPAPLRPAADLRPRIALCFHDAASLSAVLPRASELARLAGRVYLPIEAAADGSLPAAAAALSGAGLETFLRLPAVTRGFYGEWLRAHAGELGSWGVRGLLCGHPAQAAIGLDAGLELQADGTMNAFNPETLKTFAGMGFSGCLPAWELPAAAAAALEPPQGFLLEAHVRGALPVMTTEYCVAGRGSDCGRCARRGTLRGARGRRFEIRCDPAVCRSVLYARDSRDPSDIPSRATLWRVGILGEDPGAILAAAREARETFLEGGR